MDTTNIDTTPQKPLLPGGLYPNLNGLGGWFVLVIIGRFATIIIGIKTVFDFLSAYPVMVVFEVYFGVMIAYSIIWLILLSIAILIYIFKRNIKFRTLLVVQIAFYLIFSVISLSILHGILISQGMDTSTLAADTPQLFFNFIPAIIWIIYLYRSKRVKNTFIYTHRFPETFNDSGEPDTQV